MKLQPFGKRVLVKPEDKEAASSVSGLIIPDSAKEKPQKGTVMSKGVESQIPVNSLVVFGKYSGTEIEVDKVPHLVINDEDIIAIWKENE